jgi:DNA-binding MarR family transcriptional regulator
MVHAVNTNQADLADAADAVAVRFEQDPQIMLGVLSAVHSDSHITQRSVANTVGIALGLANAYLKRCLRKGYIKITHVPARRYRYYLTPTGLAEKSRLTAEFLSQSFKFFKQARSHCEEVLASCSADGWREVALVGGGELAEIVTLVAPAFGIRVTAVVGETVAGDLGTDVQVLADIDEIPDAAAVVITELKMPQAAWHAAHDRFSPSRIYAPRLLHLGVDPAASPNGDNR